MLREKFKKIMSLLPKHGLMNMYIFLQFSSPHSFIKNPQFDVDIIPPPSLVKFHHSLYFSAVKLKIVFLSPAYLYLRMQHGNVLPPFSPLDNMKFLYTVNIFRYLPNVGIIKFFGLKTCNSNVNPFSSYFKSRTVSDCSSVFKSQLE